MRLPHISDFVFSDDDLLLDAKVQLAVIDKILYNETYDKKFVIRRIHRFGSHLFLGGTETVKGFFYEEPDGENGIKTIITSKVQYLIPRNITCQKTSRIAFSNKNVFKIKRLDKLQEIVLDEKNKPCMIEYEMEESKGFSDVGKGQKGRFYIPSKNYEVVVM